MTGDPRRNLCVDARCFLNSPLFLDASSLVTLDDGVSVGHHTVFATTDHANGGLDFRSGEVWVAPITAGNSAWIAASVTPLLGMTVCAVVAAGAVVIKDVPPHTIVGGVPAKFIRRLES